MSAVLLEARGIRKYFPVTKGLLLMRVTGWIKAVDGVDFSIERGETFSLVGESGCGKTTTSRLILLLEKLTAGAILFEGKDIGAMSARELSKYRRSVQAVFQDPYSSLDPRMRVREIISEPFEVTNSLSKPERKERLGELLSQVGLRADSADDFPHEFSGGQRQRIAIARALALRPSLVILDEPVSALDVSIRAQIMNLLRQLQAELGLTYLLIAHDLAVVKHMSSRVGVMYLGEIVETADRDELYAKPLHPYTRALLSSALPSHPEAKRKEILLTGEVSSALNPPPGCRFHPRCPSAMPVCSRVEPVLEEVASRHRVACFLHSRVPSPALHGPASLAPSAAAASPTGQSTAVAPDTAK